MPGKLVVVVVLFAVAIALNVVSAALITAALQGTLLVGVLVGNEGVRSFLRGLAAVNILIAVVMSAPALDGGGPIVLVAVAISVAINAYFIWALGQDDVREWMFRKSFKLDGDDNVPKL